MNFNLVWGAVALVVVLLIYYVIFTYNKLIKAQNRIKTQWSQIDVQLVRRADLIPNLVEIVKGYASHEKEIFTNIAAARSAMSSAVSPEQVMAANDNMSKELRSLFAVAESYPDLKSNVVFIDLQSDLKDTEDKIAHARQFYNDTILIYRDKVHQFPSNIIANMFGFKDESYYAADENKKGDVNIRF